MTSLTPEAIRILADATRKGIPIEPAARLAGIGPNTLRDWLSIADGATTWPNGSPVSPAAQASISQLSEALASAAAEREAEAVERIRDYTNFRGDRDWRAEAWWLEHSPHTKRRWSQQVTVEQHGQVDHTHRLVRTLSDQQLYELLPPDYQQLAEPPPPAPDGD